MEKNVSIIVPVCSNEKYLKECLKSLCAQTLKNIEIICINEYSNDKSFEILSSFEKKDSRIRLVSKINEGCGSALNIGLNLAEGEYIGIVEPSDFVDKKMFEKLYTLSKKYDADIVKSAYFKYFEKTKTDLEKKEKISFEKSFKIPNWFFRISECPSFFSFHPSIWSSIYKRTFLNNNSIRFVEARGFSFVDNPFQVETMLLAQKIAYTGSAYYYRRQNLKSRTQEKLENAEYGKIQNRTAMPYSPSVDISDFVCLFDRADEMHEILSRYKNKDKNILANIYKRELGFIQYILETSAKNKTSECNREKLFLDNFDIKNMPYEIQLRVEKAFLRMDSDIIRNNPAFDTFEKNFYDFFSSSISNKV